MKELREITSLFPRDFLRGFFDAEEHVNVGSGSGFQAAVGAENSGKPLLLRVELLLEEPGVAFRFDRKRKAGTINTIGGIGSAMRKTMYAVLIGKVAEVRKSAKLKDSQFIGRARS